MKAIMKLLFTLLMITVMLSCSKDDPNTPPDAPLIGTATAGDAEATITFIAPSNDGGSIITGYMATSSPDNIVGLLEQAESGTITVMGLTNGTEYTFTVTARNAIGTSTASSASNTVTPIAPYYPDWYYNCYPVYDSWGYYLYDDCYWEYY
ncbi:fibronectin type III domain-containing protein [Thalassobellus suaedae]|uniref:Fibronectin type III domain-containing protein n=1 Tax=Thalassobellus suaedae TaxID=3074124 RepID=A0ABY9XQQ2_9FLAO|nr:fibronectin type III domain-containing protein [Flavobacteriaceae bacterium HL-DH14]